jgi:antitoxin component YwqK of YwqJK toxin-antitoxin module
MKFLIALPLAFILYCADSSAQNNGQRPYRSVHFDFIAKDSINLSLNNDYDLIEDSCSLVKRYAHIDMRIRKFVGKIRDVSRVDTTLTVTEGFYNTEGQKEGLFTIHYLNGQLQAKGNFKKDKYDGKWEVYYDDGKPKVFFEADDNGIQVTDYWDEKGKKAVENGNGIYSSSIGGLYWKGKLAGGKPDGNWGLYNDRSGSELASEKFKAGVFTEGKSPGGKYMDASRFELIPKSMLPFIRAEGLKVSAVPCNPVKRKRVMSAQYKHGIQAYSDELVNAVAAYFYYVDVKHFTNKFTIDGEINEEGYITNLNCYDSFNQDISGGLIRCLKRIPPLEPATIDGKPVKQKINFVFKFTQGTYMFNYGFGKLIEKT